MNISTRSVLWSSCFCLYNLANWITIDNVYKLFPFCTFFCRNNRHWVDSDLKEAAAGAYLSVPNPQNRGAHIFISHQHSTPPSLWEFIRFQNLPKVFFKVLGFLRCQVDSVRLTLSGSPKFMKEKNRLQQHHCSWKAECQVHISYIFIKRGENQSEKRRKNSFWCWSKVWSSIR